MRLITKVPPAPYVLLVIAGTAGLAMGTPDKMIERSTYITNFGLESDINMISIHAYSFIRSASSSHTGLFAQSSPNVETLDPINSPPQNGININEDYYYNSSSRGKRVNSTIGLDEAAYFGPGYNSRVYMNASVSKQAGWGEFDSLKIMIAQNTRQIFDIENRFSENENAFTGCISYRSFLTIDNDGCSLSFFNNTTDTERIVACTMTEIRSGSSTSPPLYVGSSTRTTFSSNGGFSTEESQGMPVAYLSDDWAVFPDGSYIHDSYNVIFSDEFLDLTGDNRFSQEDLDQLESMISASSYDVNFDFDGDGVLTTSRDAALLKSLLNAGASAGLLGDGDNDGDVDCTDLIAAVSHSFATPVYASSGSYVIQYDADLDGDNDSDDLEALAELFLGLEPANLYFDGVLDIFDVLEFNARFTTMDPSVDFYPPGNPDGVFDIFDVIEFTGLYNNPTCLPTPAP